MPTQKFASTIPPELEEKLESLRSSKGLAPVAGPQEGAPLGNLPDQIYGFTFSPLNESTPLFARRLFQSFEVHKLAEGAVEVLGFVTSREAQAIRDAADALDLNLYPEPKADSSELVQLPLDRIAKAKPASRCEGNYMPVHLDSR